MGGASSLCGRGVSCLRGVSTLHGRGVVGATAPQQRGIGVFVVVDTLCFVLVKVLVLVGGVTVYSVKEH